MWTATKSKHGETSEEPLANKAPTENKEAKERVLRRAPKAARREKSRGQPTKARQKSPKKKTNKMQTKKGDEEEG